MAQDVRVFGPAIERVQAARRSLGEAVGSLEMAQRGDDRELLAGYTGSSALKRLRLAQREVSKALDLLNALAPR